ncbi:uncharacterized protein TNIN_246131 [Trichonephila inaurata madagascariensis]|uniref:CCHC-type domain-containing protein n=1 Tax=Trichonephila inaurata madagascariensis TaxID=2747483 RepID=A0A8X6X8I3_9ARAC|nr:uncharacterized protein TNIN_246131 [Trichonephila inaurata madagascariensis]
MTSTSPLDVAAPTSPIVDFRQGVRIPPSQQLQHCKGVVEGVTVTQCGQWRERGRVSRWWVRARGWCYNCGEFANHIAAKCSMGPQPKRCHNCKSVDHLIADCPNRQEGSGKKKSHNNNNNDSCDNKNNGGDDSLCRTVLGNGGSFKKTLLVDDEEDDEDVQLHDHRINCSSSPASSCGTGSPLGKREL